MKPKLAAAVLATTFAASPAWAAGEDGRDPLLAQLVARLEAQEARILELERQLQAAELPAEAPGTVQAAPPAAARTASEDARAGDAGNRDTALAQADGADAPPTRVNLSGDLRLRYEHNGSDNDAPNDGRAVLRARLRAAYEVNEWLALGGQVVTGSQDDPNTADVTLGNFNDDLEISLDQAFLHLSRGGLELWGGKFPQVFRRTDLVWDGDVSPQGVAVRYRAPLAEGLSLGATGMYFPIERSVAGPDSTMTGAQVELAATASGWSAALAAAYYDYSLGSVASADAGDFRGNLRDLSGAYLSDFGLVDVIARLDAQPWDERWPVTVTADYVRNLGAATADDSGYSVAVALGRSQDAGDWRFGYAYTRAEADAVFAAFSHDNINLSTNYRMHAATADYVYREGIVLNATLYLYRPDSPLHAGAADPEDLLSRLRLNALFRF